MAASSPSSEGSKAPVTRRPSTRHGLRRLPSRTRTAEANGRPTSRSAEDRPKKFDLNESSDDEMPKPMKLSSLTRALLNDDVAEAERAQSPPPVRRRSVLSSATSGVAATNGVATEKRLVKRSGGMRTTRSTSTRLSSRPTSRQSSRLPSPQCSRDNSPVRKRVVRLSATPVGGTRVHRRSNSTSGSSQHQRPISQSSVDDNKEDADGVNTPAHGVRQVRIAVGSSATRARSTASSAAGSRRTDASTNSDYEAVEEPRTANKPQTALNQGSIPRFAASTAARTRPDEAQHPQGSMRIKRVGKGSFLSGPARRGRRRQSEEEHSQLDEQEGNIAARTASQDPDGQVQRDEIAVPFMSSLYGVGSHPDVAASGSPSSAASRRKSSSARSLPEAQKSPKEPEKVPEKELENHYQLPGPRAEALATQDKENGAPAIFNKQPSIISTFHEDSNALKPLKIDLGPPARHASPERKPLTALSKNAPLRAAPAPPPKMNVLAGAAASTGAAAAQSRKRNMLKMNNKYYMRVKCLGRGGSAKVYRVTTDNGEMLAMKRVSTENADEAQVKGYKGEIDLLKKLSGCERVINLLEYEMNEEKQLLSLLMEPGDLDFNVILREKHAQENAQFDPVFVRFYWKEMVECVRAIHQSDVVHSDLKPANFVSVHGRLKLIDFGIANAIQTDETVNVHRDTQVGTPNYMSPESLIDSNQVSGARLPGKPKLMKLGKPSDIWSLGCILYQMVYANPPFGHIPNQYARCHAIINWTHSIDFPEQGIGGIRVPHSLIRTMKRCLSRDVQLRPTAEELLSPADPFLYPVEVGADCPTLPMTEDLLGRIIHSVVVRCKDGLPSDAELMSVWPQAYWVSAKKHLGVAIDNNSNNSNCGGKL